ncbi:MAG: biopolymer transporter ExbD [Pseudomonadota bacterium]
MPTLSARPAALRRYSSTPRPHLRKLNPPMGEMNVTPFIDVLLVLLIMIIMAVPIKVHETTVDLPTTPCTACEIGETNVVSITAADELLWNGTRVTPDQLRIQIERTAAASPEPTLRFEPDALASYDRSARTIALIKESGATKFAFVGNGRYKDFGS